MARDEWSESWSCPQTPRTPGIDPTFGISPLSWQACGRLVPPSSYSLSEVFSASPSFWQNDPSAQTLDKLGAQRLSSTRFPASKVVLFEGITVHISGAGERTWDQKRPESTVAFADLRAEVRDFRTATPGVYNRFNPGAMPVMLSTLNGVAGRDY